MCVCVCVRERERQGESSNRVRKFQGNFSKFCEPLERSRARFSEKKIPPKKAHWAAKTKEKNILRGTGAPVGPCSGRSRGDWRFFPGVPE